MKVSKRRASFAARYWLTSKPLTSPAIRDGSEDASKRVIGPIPDFPASMLPQACGTPTPTGDTMPRPVTTTLRLAKSAPWRESGCFPRSNEVDGLLHRRDFLGLLVGDLGLEFLFERHHELNGVQRIRAEVVHERRF